MGVALRGIAWLLLAGSLAGRAARIVTVDRRSRGLLVDGLATLPVGFYVKQYGPRVAPKWTDITSQSMLQIPADEGRHGFTHISPYMSTNICMDANLSSAEGVVESTTRAGMEGIGLDLSRIVSGYSFAGSRCTPEGKMATLQSTVRTLAPSQGLLFHYLMDEPNERIFPLETVLSASQAIRHTDPHHPIAGCFRPGSLQANPGYGAAIDIVMTDPYFIARAVNVDHPGVNLSSTCPGGGSCNATYRVAELVEGLLQATNFSKAIWLVPSVFGGGEAWWRQPTPYEMRAVSYAAIVHGATGLQYFVRSAPNVHPSSVRLWSEVRAVAMELTILAPWLLSAEATPEVFFHADNDAVHLKAWTRRGITIIIAVNMINSPTALHFDHPLSSSALEVLWHDRSVQCTGLQSVTRSVCRDLLDGFATRVYRSRPPLPKRSHQLIRNGGFESSHVLGVPDDFFVNGGGSTPHLTSSAEAFMILDGRTSHSGDWSLRMVSPGANCGLVLTAFPVELQTNRSYVASVWARARPSEVGVVMTMGAPNGGWETPMHTFHLGDEGVWAQYNVTITRGATSTDMYNGQLMLSLASRGTLWVDDFELVDVGFAADNARF